MRDLPRAHRGGRDVICSPSTDPACVSLRGERGLGTGFFLSLREREIMSNIKKYAVALTSRLHLLNGNDEPMYADGADGNPDKTKPMVANLYGPGSRQFAKAQADQQNRMIDKLKKKGKTTETADEKNAERAKFLAACTESLENVTDGDLQGQALFEAVYSDIEIGFVAEQVGKHLGDWGNFTKPSTTT